MDEILWIFVVRLEKVALLILWSNYFVQIALPADIYFNS